MLYWKTPGLAIYNILIRCLYLSIYYICVCVLYIYICESHLTQFLICSVSFLIFYIHLCMLFTGLEINVGSTNYKIRHVLSNLTSLFLLNTTRFFWGRVLLHNPSSKLRSVTFIMYLSFVLYWSFPECHHLFCWLRFFYVLMVSMALKLTSCSVWTYGNKNQKSVAAIVLALLSSCGGR